MITSVSQVADAMELVTTILLKLYLKEVAGLGPGPHQRSSAVVGTTPRRQEQEPE
jgi:hypothetical protein